MLNFTVRSFPDEKVKRWRNELAIAAKNAMAAQKIGRFRSGVPLIVMIYAVFPRPRVWQTPRGWKRAIKLWRPWGRRIDSIAKIVIDGLNTVVFEHLSSVVSVAAMKFVAPEGGESHVRVSVHEAEEV